MYACWHFFFSMESTVCNSALDLSTVIKSGRTNSNAGRDRVEWRKVCPRSIVVCEAGFDASSQALLYWWHGGKLALRVLQRNLPLHVRTALVWVVRQRVVVSYRRLGQPVGLILKGHGSPLTFEDRTDRFSRNVVKKLPLLSPRLQGSRIPLDPWNETNRLSRNVGKKLSLPSPHLQGSRIPVDPWNECNRSRNVSKKLSLLIPHRQGSRRRILDPLKMGPIGCPETSVRNCHYLVLVFKDRESLLTLEMRPVSCPETSVRSYHYPFPILKGQESLLTLEMSVTGCPETSVRSYHYSFPIVKGQEEGFLTPWRWDR